MKARRVTEPEFLRELVFKFPRTARGRAEFEARFIFVAAVWQRAPARRRTFLLRTYGLVGHTHIAMGVERRELVELTCALVEFWGLHVNTVPELARACVDRVRWWYAELAAWDVRTMMRAERMVVALREQGKHTVLLFRELVVALSRVPWDAVLRVYHAYLALWAAHAPPA